MGKELLEAKRIEEENERKRYVHFQWILGVISSVLSGIIGLLFLLETIFLVIVEEYV